MVGEQRVKSNPIVDIFFDGPRTAFIGGAGVTYFLYHQKDTTPVLSDLVNGYHGYNKFRKFTWWNMVPNDLDSKKKAK